MKCPEERNSLTQKVEGYSFAKDLEWGRQSGWFMGMSFFEGDENFQKVIIVKVV